MADNVDFDEEGRKILDSLNLPKDQRSAKSFASRYNPLDAVWMDKETGGTIFVGNQQAAQNSGLLMQHKIKYIVNCTSNMSNFHEDNDHFTYLRFDVCHGLHSYALMRQETRPPYDIVLHNFRPAFQFIENALAKGDSVLVHCLAGAHRAGSTGIACLMYFGNFGADQATTLAQGVRPIISPIGFFSQYLMDLEVALKRKREADKKSEE